MDLNDKEIAEIKTTWLIPIANPADSGQAILIRFFEKYPSNLQKFPSFKNVPVSELKENARFRAHSTRIIRTFDEAINSLGTDSTSSKLQDIWSEIAKSHFKREISKESYNDLKEIIVEVLSAVCELNEFQLEAWSKFLDICYDIIFTTIDQL